MVSTRKFVAGSEEERLLAEKLMAETATCPFRELQRFFAQGVLVHVSPQLDLLEVGVAFALDDTERMAPWRAAGAVGLLEDQVAGDYLAQDRLLWTMVVKPWVLVQPADAATPTH